MSQTTLCVVRLLAVAHPLYYKQRVSNDCIRKTLYVQWFIGCILGVMVRSRNLLISLNKISQMSTVPAVLKQTWASEQSTNTTDERSQNALSLLSSLRQWVGNVYYAIVTSIMLISCVLTNFIAMRHTSVCCNANAPAVLFPSNSFHKYSHAGGRESQKSRSHSVGKLHAR